MTTTDKASSRNQSGGELATSAGGRGDRIEIGGGAYWRRHTPMGHEPLYDLMGPDGGFVNADNATEAEARAFAALFTPPRDAALDRSQILERYFSVHGADLDDRRQAERYLAYILGDSIALNSQAPPPRSSSIDIDYDAAKRVRLMVEQVRAAGLTEAAEVFRNAYWGWLRTLSAYVAAHPYVKDPEPPSMTPISALSVTDFTIRHWAPLIPGSPMIDDAAVMKAVDDDEAWHRSEDRRVRRNAGEEI